MQVLNLAPCSNLSLVLPHARLTGLHGWSAVGQAVGALYAQDIWDNQVRCLKLQTGVSWQLRTQYKVGAVRSGRVGLSGLPCVCTCV